MSVRALPAAGARGGFAPSRGPAAWLALLVALMIVGALAFIYQFASGLVVTGMRNTAMSHWYVPTIVEWLVVVGILAFGALLFTFAVAFLPMRESADH